MTSRGSRLLALVAVAVTLAIGLALTAQQPPTIKRTVAFKTDLLGCADREGVVAWVDLPVGAAEGKHTHNAEVFAFVVEGTITLENKGSPKTTLKAGDTFHYLPGRWHEAANVGTTPAKLAAVFNRREGQAAHDRREVATERPARGDPRSALEGRELAVARASAARE